MVQVPKSCCLKNLQDQVFEAAIEDLSVDKARGLIDETWGPEYSMKHDQDSHWLWERKAGEAVTNDFVRCKKLTLAGSQDIQAAMSYDISGRFRSNPSIGAVYLKFLAAAPQNRWWREEKRKYCGCGVVMLVYVVRESKFWGLKGRVVLEALDDAVGFYEGCGFNQVGQSSENGLPIYELKSESAVELLKRYSNE